MIDDLYDRRLALRADGLLAEFNRADVLAAADVHVATRLGTMLGEADQHVLLAAALAVRAVRHGSVCVDLATVAELPLEEDVALAWPDPAGWVDRVADSPLVTEAVLRLVDSRLYLDRYWREEGQVCSALLTRLERAAPVVDESALEAGLERVFAGPGYDEQRAAARASAQRWTTVLTGGPGTGKTTTVAGLLALVAEQHESSTGRLPRIAMCAPTAKAAARLQEAVADATSALPETDRDRLGHIPAMTLHRLLGWRPGSSVRFRHDRDNRLPHDVVVVDETSMVSLTHMARLLDALRSSARLVLVGDADQLASVEAGAVLADLVEAVQERTRIGVAALVTSHRFGESIGGLAEAVRRGDADEAVALLEAGGDHVTLLDVPDPAAAIRGLVAPHALEVLRTAERGEAERALELLEQKRLLCAHREGPHGVRHWNAQVERWLGEETGEPIWSTWYAGRPLLVTANDYGLGIYNGDVGVAVRPPRGSPHRALRAAIDASTGLLDLATSRVAQVETMHALTIHKSQGSQADEVVVVLPPPESRLLTRELFYTAITRARERVVVVGSPGDVRAAIDRRAVRATGLRQRLAGPSVP
jgi:exodeoxyribonuclease V alpha subunit